jgi:hypothetical protein
VCYTDFVGSSLSAENEDIQPMKTLQITRIKPNPAGKDKTPRGMASASQLGAEWVDFKNTGALPVNVAGVDLYHLAYAPGAPEGKWDKIMDFTGTLPAGQTVRVHSGSGPESAIRPEDRAGAEHHVFTGRNYVWNNRQGDKPTLFEPAQKQNIDQATYDPYPPEGEFLVRSGSKLVPAFVPAYVR